MPPVAQAFASGFPLALLHTTITLLVLVGGCAVYVLLSKYKEFNGINEGNGAAAISLVGVVLGLGIPLAASLAASPSLIEILLWGVAITAVQLLVFVLIDLLLSGLPERAMAGDVSAAALLASAKIAAALILAAAVAG